METVDKSTIAPELSKYLEEIGYTNFIQTENYGLVAFRRFAFTFGLVIGLTRDDYVRRYCYPDYTSLVIGSAILLTQDKMEEPPFHPEDPYWIKCKGNGIDVHNKNNPTIDHRFAKY